MSCLELIFFIFKWIENEFLLTQIFQLKVWVAIEKNNLLPVGLCVMIRANVGVASGLQLIFSSCKLVVTQKNIFLSIGTGS
jgi:hypothetical protein